MQAKPGIWTPKAEVLCYECHGSHFYQFSGKYVTVDIEEFAKPIELHEHNAITKCNKCGTAIQLSESIAEENNIVLELRTYGYEAHMEQTGGMCDAASVMTTDGHRYMFTYGLDGGSEYSIGLWRTINNDGEDEYVDGSGAEFGTYAEFMAYLRQLPDLKIQPW